MSTLDDVVQAAVAKAVSNALVQAKLDAHPVGSYYWSSESTSPEELFGGTWEQVKDRFVYAVGDDSAAGDTGGEATHTLTVAETPAHTHTRGTMDITGSFKNYWSAINSPEGAFTGDQPSKNCTDTGGNSANQYYDKLVFTASKTWTGKTSSVGGGAAHNNLPPFVRAYCWRRTA